jgi:hypothetical protein
VLAPPNSSVFSACGGAGLNQMHIHEKSLSVGMFNKHTQSIFGDFEMFNGVVEGLEHMARKDLLRQGIAESQILHRLELDMSYGQQKMQVSVVAPKTRLTSKTDVIGLIELMNDDFGERYWKQIVSPESGVWVHTIRVVSLVELPALKFSRLNPPEHKMAALESREVRQCHFVGVEGALETPVYDQQALEPGIVIAGGRHHQPGHDHLPDGARLALRIRCPGRGLVYSRLRHEVGEPEMAVSKAATSVLDAEQALVNKFLHEQKAFLGPDPEIQLNHHIHQRSPREDETMLAAWIITAWRIFVPACRRRWMRPSIFTGKSEVAEMTVATPAAQCGDMSTGYFTAGGNLTLGSTRGIAAFTVSLNYPVRYINKYVLHDETVGVRPGDGFLINDCHYGGVHTPDQHMFMPIFSGDELVAWCCCALHEG